MTTIGTVGILSPGEMGAAVGKVLGYRGMRVVTCLQGRSDWTRSRAQEAGIADLPSYEELVQAADLLLSILAPAQAPAAAQRVAQALRSTGAPLVYADCNAISPQRTQEIAQTVTDAGGEFIDAAIIGSPPTKDTSPRIHASGPNPQPLAELRGYGLDVRVMGDRPGQASGLKMLYAASTKGTVALWTEILAAAETMDLADALRQEIESGQPDQYQRLERTLATMPARSGRYVGEMEEIAATFESLGLTPRIYQGAADMFRLVSQTTLANYPSGHHHAMAEILDTLRQTLAAGAEAKM